MRWGHWHSLGDVGFGTDFLHLVCICVIWHPLEIPWLCRTASAMWILPKRPAHQTACMVHLAATGDHGYARRMHLGLPLVEQVGQWHGSIT